MMAVMKELIGVQEAGAGAEGSGGPGPDNFKVSITPYEIRNSGGVIIRETIRTGGGAWKYTQIGS